MKIKFKTLSGKYIKIPADIIYSIDVNRRISFATDIPRPIRNDEPVDCSIELLNGNGKIDIIIINQFDVMVQYQKFLHSKV